MSLRSKIALVATTLVILAVAVTTLLQVGAARRAVLEQAKAGGNEVALLLARAVSFAEEVPRQVEGEIAEQMKAEATLLAHLVAALEKAGEPVEAIRGRLVEIASRFGMELLATDPDGEAYLYSDDPTGEKRFRFSGDPRKQPQAHAFHRLLEEPRGTSAVVQDARKREVDDRVFKYVGVGGVDKPRIVQVGLEAFFLERLDENLGLQRLVAELVGGEVREVRIFDARLDPRVTRRLSDDGIASDSPSPLDPADASLLAEAIDSGRPAGRIAGDLYRVAAPVPRGEGRGGAVLVAVSTSNSREVLIWQAIAAAAAAVGIGIPGVVVSLWLARSIAEPVRQAADVAESIAAGDLTVKVPGSPTPEVGRLLGAIDSMTAALSGLIGRIQAAGERLSSVEADAAEALARQDRSIRGFGESASEVAAAVSEISATSEQLLESTSRVTAVAREAAEVADAGRGGLVSMTESMQKLDEAMNAFTRKLSTISQRAGGITSVVTTIAKVADQTNLLSVNATIEAEKAGESGRGFRIVAQEIRRLADQTALATKDIERMVRDMQSAVSGGTMEMDRFRSEVGLRIGEVAEVSEQLGRVIEPVQSVTEALGHVHEGMQTQTQGARQIRETMRSLTDNAEVSGDSMRVVSGSLDSLRAAICELNAEAAHFRTSEQPPPREASATDGVAAGGGPGGEEPPQTGHDP
jgi:methyl-accepting chemotaxis protein